MYSWPFPLAKRALARQMSHTRGKFSGASGSFTAKFSFFAFSCSTVQSTICWSVFAPASRAARTTSKRTPIELGIEGHPAQAHRLRDLVNGVALRPAGVRRHGEIVGEVPIVAPLIPVHVVPDGRLLLPRRLLPVEGECDGPPRREGGDLLLADVVIEAAAVLPAAPAEKERGGRRPVAQVVAEPVVHPGADDDHGPALRRLGVGRELPGQADDALTADARSPLLPGGGVQGVVVVALRILARACPCPRRAPPPGGRTPW